MSLREAWQILEKAYRGDNRVKQVRFQTLRGEESENGEQRTSGRVCISSGDGSKSTRKKWRGVVYQPYCGEDPKEFENIVCAIEESKDSTMFSIEELVGSLEAHKQ